MKPILIDCSLTGGRGPAKKVYELCTDLKKLEIPFHLITDEGFVPKLRDLGIEPDYIVKTKISDPPLEIMEKFLSIIKGIDYGFMVKIGARMAGPHASKVLKKPYIIADGGLPDYMTEEEGLYNRETFQKAEKYYVTTQFEWVPPNRLDLDNVEVCCYPIAEKTFNYIDVIKKNSKLKNLELIKDKVDGNLPKNEDDLLIDIVMTGSYVLHTNRVTYGAWLKADEYDMVVGYLRRLVTDLGETFETVYIFMDSDLLEVVSDLREKYGNLHILTYKGDWDMEVELVMKAASDVTISRATNYQPYIATLGKGCNVTTPVPAAGYMDEDSAGVQYAEMGYTRLIEYNDEDYIFKLKAFLQDTEEQGKIAKKLIDNKFVKERNLIKIVLDRYKNQ